MPQNRWRFRDCARRVLDHHGRLLTAYVARRPSHLTFWHDVPEPNTRAVAGALGEYHMTFRAKADYPGPYDGRGVPLLDYHGAIGRQYNPIAIAQWGLGNFNRFKETGDGDRRRRFLVAADWLAANLEPNRQGVWVWHHRFDWPYRETLRAPWYSALAQGQGVSLLVRAFHETGEERYFEAASRAFRAFAIDVGHGGVSYRDELGRIWFEEYLVDPPSHILNGFLWASWGVYDYALLTRDGEAMQLFDSAVQTLAANLDRYDTGYWSLYELSRTRLPMLASPFYHRLHIVQLEVMAHLTGQAVFRDFARRWEGYERDSWKRYRALAGKVLFKLLHY
jgi:heparosan-N-sulfate-glucuronate 5-epimerase